jgi:hypothetical protein
VKIPGVPDGLWVDVDKSKFAQLKFRRLGPWDTYPRPISEMLAAYMRELEAAGYIESTTIMMVSYASPVRAERKGNAPSSGKASDTHWVALDLRGPNSCTNKAMSVIPKWQAMSTYLVGMKYFGKLDAANGYWLLPLHPQCRKYFVLCTDRGTWIPT